MAFLSALCLLEEPGAVERALGLFCREVRSRGAEGCFAWLGSARVPRALAQALPEERVLPGVHGCRFVWEGIELKGRCCAFPRGLCAREIAGPFDFAFFEEPSEAPVFFHALSDGARMHFERLPVPPERLGLARDPLTGFWRFAMKRRRGGMQRLLRTAPESGRVMIVGAGLAGAFTAYALSRRGIRSVVLDAGCAPASGASALYAGLVHPHWQAAESPLSALTRSGFGAMRELLLSFPEVFEPAGVIEEAADEAEWLRWRNVRTAAPEDFMRLVDAREGSALAGMPLRRGGWWFPVAGLVRVSALVRALLDASGARVLCGTPVVLVREGDFWEARALDTPGRPGGWTAAEARSVVAAAGMGSPSVIGASCTDYGLSALHGRISLLRDTDLAGLRTALTGGGYLFRTEGFAAAGATYEREGKRLEVRAAHEKNGAVLRRLLKDAPEVLPTGFYEGDRCVALDRLPIAGALAQGELLASLHFRGRPEVRDMPATEGLWGLFALGSRGLTWGWAAAGALADLMTGRPPALSASLLRSLAPLRFAARRF